MDLDKYEANLDTRYREMKEAISLLKANAGMFGMNQDSPGLIQVPASGLVSKPAAGAKASISNRVRSVIDSLPGDFCTPDIAGQLSDLTTVQISNTLSMLRKQNEIHIIKIGTGGTPFIYRKGPKPS